MQWLRFYQFLISLFYLFLWVRPQVIVMKEEFTVNEHKSVGPYTDLYGHGPVIFIQDVVDNRHIDEQLWACLDCGYTTNDNRAFLHEDCVRERNEVNQTFREHLEENDYPDGD